MDYSLLDHLLNPVLVIDASQKLVYFNHICSTYFKLPPRKLSKIEAITDLIKTNEQFVTSIKQAFTENSPIVTSELEISLPESPQNILTVIFKMIPIKNQLLIHVWDMSIEKQLHDKYKNQIIQLKENHEQIVLSDKLTALGELISGIGHEVSNPMTIITDRLLKLNENLIKKDLISLKANLKDVDREIKRVNKIMANMQNFVRNQDEELEILSLSKVIFDSVNFIKELNILGAIKLNVDIKNEQFVLANSVKIQQIMINLIKNSIDALAHTKNPEIKIELVDDQDEQMSRISVIDNGVGIAPEVKDKLFEMFYTSKELGEGTGLGLSISQKIAESFYGQLFLAESQIGATFILRLPFIEFSTFTKTNDYLNGKKESEDPKVLLYGENIFFLNRILKMFEDKDFVIIVTRDKNQLKELIEFYDAFVVIAASPLEIELDVSVVDISDQDDITIEQLLPLVVAHE